MNRRDYNRRVMDHRRPSPRSTYTRTRPATSDDWSYTGEPREPNDGWVHAITRDPDQGSLTLRSNTPPESTLILHSTTESGGTTRFDDLPGGVSDNITLDPDPEGLYSHLRNNVVTNGEITVEGGLATNGDMDVSGTLRVHGDLIIDGITTTINSEVITELISEFKTDEALLKRLTQLEKHIEKLLISQKVANTKAVTKFNNDCQKVVESFTGNIQKLISEGVAEHVKSITSNDVINAAVTAAIERINSKECVSCLEERRSLACIPCGHQCICESCSKKIEKCPICREEVNCYVKIYR